MYIGLASVEQIFVKNEDITVYRILGDKKDARIMAITGKLICGYGSEKKKFRLNGDEMNIM